MKKAKDAVPIQTIPHGVYESGLINHEQHRKKSSSCNDLTTDAQGNGYPVEDCRLFEQQGLGNNTGKPDSAPHS